MLDKLKYKIAEFIALRNLKGFDEPEKDFNKFFSESRKILLILPIVQDDVNNCLDFFHFLVNNHKKVKLLRIAAVKISDLNTTDIINLKETDYNKLNLPNKEFITNLRKEDFDITIDLGRENNLIAGYLTKQSNTKYKIGFKKENSDIYYNFQVSDSSINSQISYRNLLNSLLMF